MIQSRCALRPRRWTLSILVAASLWVLGGMAAFAEDIVALVQARDYPKAALEIGSILKAAYPEARSDTRACERAVNRGDVKALQGACELDPGYINETPVELTNIAMGRMARGQFFGAAKAVAALHRVRPTDGSAELTAALAHENAGNVSAFQQDLTQGGQFVTAAIAGFDHATGLAEAGDWKAGCQELDRAIPTLPDYRNIHLLRFVICARAGTDRRVALADYGKSADDETKVLIGIVLGELSASDAATRLKLTPASPAVAVESQYYAAEAAYLAGDQAAYRAALAAVTAAAQIGLFEQRLAAAEARHP
jgi:hypothetical protein